MNSQHPRSWFERAQEDQARMDYLAQAGVDPARYAAARMSEAEGFELPKLAQQQLFAQALLNIASQKHYRPPLDHEAGAVYFGDAPASEDSLTLGTLMTGAVGSGKTHAILTVMSQLRGKGIKMRFWDYKGEARRLPVLFPDAKVFSPQTAPWQFFQPPAGVDPMAFGIGVITELRIGSELRAETFPLLYSIWERILRGMRPGDPWPSLSDIRRVVLDEAEKAGRDNLFTVARMLLSIEVLLGPNARVRYVPKDESQFDIEAHDLVGQDPKMIRLFLGLHLNELLLRAQAQEHTTKLRAVEIIDEIAPLASVDVTRTLHGDLNGLQRFATMARFTGTGLIMGAQNCSRLDVFVKNVGNLVVFRPPSFEDALDAACLLGLPPESARLLIGLPVGHAYVRSVGWEQPVLVQFPRIEP